MTNFKKLFCALSSLLLCVSVSLISYASSSTDSLELSDLSDDTNVLEPNFNQTQNNRVNNDPILNTLDELNNFFRQSITSKIVEMHEDENGNLSLTYNTEDRLNRFLYPTFISYQAKKIIVNCHVSELPKNCFKNFNNLETVIFKYDVERIGEYAFKNCTSLKDVIFEGNVTVIGTGAFSNCSALENVSFKQAAQNEGNANITNFGDYCFSSCSSLKSISLPKNTVCISKAMFHKCTSLNEIKNLDGLKHLYEECFAFCNSLKSIELPQSVNLIKSGAFKECTSLKSINIPSSVKKIQSHTFAGCISLSSINNSESGDIIIPSNIKFIESSAFNKCNSIIHLSTTNDGTLSICEYAFCDCKNLEDISFGNSTKMLFDGAFECCPNLVSIKIPAVRTIGSRCFYNCPKLRFVYQTYSLNDISKYAFCDCKSLSHIDKLERVYKIHQHAFSGCSSLKCIQIENCLNDNDYTRISPYAFRDCSSLESIHLSKCSLGNSAFYKCKNLKNINIEGNVQSDHNDVFVKCNSEAEIIASGSGKGKLTNTRYLITVSNLGIPVDNIYVLIDNIKTPITQIAPKASLVNSKLIGLM